MRMLWCWRCQQEVAMLDPQEEHLALTADMAAVETEAARRGQPLLLLPEAPVGRVAHRLRPMLEMYRLLTGIAATNPNAVFHHFASLYGPPCPQCHKPLRAAEARFCAACGFGQADIASDPRPLAERKPELFE